MHALLKKILEGKTTLEEESPELIEYLHSGEPLQELLGLSDSALELKYQEAHTQHAKGNFSASTELFQLLAQLNPYRKNIWISLAFSHHAQENFDEAIKAHLMAVLLEPQDPKPYYFISLDFLALKEWDNALIALDLSIDLAQEKKHYMGIKEKASTIRQKLKAALSSQEI